MVKKKRLIVGVAKGRFRGKPSGTVIRTPLGLKLGKVIGTTESGLTVARPIRRKARRR